MNVILYAAVFSFARQKFYCILMNMKPRNATEVHQEIIQARMKIAATLRRARAIKGLTQTILSERTGLSRPQISIMESGDAQEIGINKFLRLCDALGLELVPVDPADTPMPQQQQEPTTINKAEIVDEVVKRLIKRLSASFF